MNKSISIICGAAAILLGVCACKQESQVTQTPVDLRYRVADSYQLPASGAQAFTITVTSSAPWTISSQHPDWCIIEQEEGPASDPAMVLVGKGDKTSVKVQYYDNLDLDDRIDKLEIRSDYWLGKTVTVYQKGIAYLNIPEEEAAFLVEKAGGELEFHVFANQKWTAAVTDGDWVSITEGSEGEGDGVIKVNAVENPEEQRYATITVFDRHGVEAAVYSLTQDGVQLDPATFEIRTGFDQLATSLDVVANSKWTAVKSNDNDTWFSIDNPDNEGNASLKITLTKNSGTGLRTSSIILRSVPTNPGDFVAEKEIILKQAYYIAPVRYIFDSEEIGKWSSDKGIDPVYIKGTGTFFTGGESLYSRLHNGEMPFGTYTFHWSSIDPAARVRHWFCYGDGQEIKYNIVAASGKLAMEFNASSSGVSGKPDMISSYEIDINQQPIEVSLKFDPSGADYCHVTYLYNGIEVCSFDSSDSVMHKVTWGSDINMYVGVDTGGSAVCEWYEYTEPINWNE